MSRLTLISPYTVSQHKGGGKGELNPVSLTLFFPSSIKINTNVNAVTTERETPHERVTPSTSKPTLSVPGGQRQKGGGGQDVEVNTDMGENRGPRRGHDTVNETWVDSTHVLPGRTPGVEVDGGPP